VASRSAPPLRLACARALPLPPPSGAPPPRLQDALIIKTFVFQFINSYGPLFYLAFVKPYSLALFDSWGLRDPYGNPYVDTCGVRGVDWWAAVNCSVTDGAADGCQYDCADKNYLYVREDCWGDLRVQMICFTLLKPLYELPIQILLPRFMRWWRMGRRDRSIRRQLKAAMTLGSSGHAAAAAANGATNVQQVVAGADADSDAEAPPPAGGTTHSAQGLSALARFRALEAYSDSIEHQMALEPFRGTFMEYNTKVVQVRALAEPPPPFVVSPCFACTEAPARTSSASPHLP
jgi:hypothetical protein